MAQGGQLPGWLSRLLKETFYMECKTHKGKDTYKNIFCLHCCISLCPQCVPAHPSHRLLKVGRCLFADAVKLDELEQLINCSLIQSYPISTGKAIILKPKPEHRILNNMPKHICLHCLVIVLAPFRFCCLTCKVEHYLRLRLDISGLLSQFRSTQFQSQETVRSNFPHGEDFPSNQILPNPEDKDALQHEGSSSGSGANEKGDSSEKNGGHNLSHGSRRK